MRSRFLLGTATLVASIAVASAQQPMQGGGGWRAQGGAAEQRSQSPQAQPVQRGQDSQPQRARDQTTGQGQREQQDQGQSQQRQGESAAGAAVTAA